jgi:hypothetical protein
LKVLVCGGRDEASRDYVWRGLDSFHREHEITALVHGDAGKTSPDGSVYCGADKFAGEWARRKKIPVIARRAMWREFGLRAGPIRNQAMLEQEKPECVIAFAGGRGTADMVRRAEMAGVKVVRYHRESTAPVGRFILPKNKSVVGS